MSDESIATATGLSLQWVRAIRAVESGGIASQCRFEPHVFARLTGGMGEGDHTTVVIVQPGPLADATRAALWAQGRIPYTPDPLRHISLVRSETDRQAFERASAIDGEAAVRSSSWGAFQVLGGHLLAVTGASPDAAVAAFDADPPAMSDRLLVHWIAGNLHARDAALRGDVDGWVSIFNGSKPGTPQHEHYAARMRTALAAAA